MTTIQNKKIMPVLVLIIAVGFQSIDIFTAYDISESQLTAIDVFLAPFGLGGLIRAGHKTYVESKTNSSEISEEDQKKLNEILSKIKKKID